MALLSVVTNLFDRVGGIGMTLQQPLAPPQKEEDGMANSSVTALSATVSMPLSPPPLQDDDQGKEGGNDKDDGNYLLPLKVPVVEDAVQSFEMTGQIDAAKDPAGHEYGGVDFMSTVSESEASAKLGGNYSTNMSEDGILIVPEQEEKDGPKKIHYEKVNPKRDEGPHMTGSSGTDIDSCGADR